MLADAGVLQGEFQTFEELVNNDPWCSLENPLFGEIDQPFGSAGASGWPAGSGSATGWGSPGCGGAEGLLNSAGPS